MINELIMAYEAKFRIAEREKEELNNKKKDLEKKFVTQSTYKA